MVERNYNEFPSQKKEVLLRDSQADDYNKFIIRTRGIFGYKAELKTIISHLKVKKDDVVFDAGCGTGIYTITIAKSCTYVLAVDFSQRSVDLLNKKSKKLNLENIETDVADLALIELPRDKFDKAISIEVIQHIPSHVKKVLVLKNIYRSLKPDGKFIMVVYRWGGWIKFPKLKEESDHGGVGLYRFAFTVKDCYELLNEAGFNIEHIGGVLNLNKKIRKYLPSWMSFIEVWLSRLSLSRNLGEYLLIIGRKPS